MTTPFNTKLRELRKRAGLTQEQLAEIVGASTPSISDWENSLPRPRLQKHIDALCSYFGVSENELLYGDIRSPDFGLPIVGSSESAFLPFLGHAHAGEFEDPLTIDGAMVEVPKSIADAHPGGRVIVIDGHCVDRVANPGDLAVIDSTVEPQNGSVVCARLNGELILRRMFRGNKVLMLSPDSYSDEFEDIIFREGEDDRELDLEGVMVWHQAAHEMR